MFINLSQYINSENKADVKKRLIYLYNQLSPVNEISDTDFDLFVNTNNTFAYIMDNKIVGCITMIVENKFIRNGGKVLHIEDLVVDKDYRDKGIGNQLLTLAKQIAKGRKCYKIILDCNNSVKHFYIKNGFQSKNMQMSLYF